MNISLQTLKQTCQIQEFCVRKIIKHPICLWIQQVLKHNRVGGKNQTIGIKEAFKSFEIPTFILTHQVLRLNILISLWQTLVHSQTTTCSSTSCSYWAKIISTLISYKLFPPTLKTSTTPMPRSNTLPPWNNTNWN